MDSKVFDPSATLFLVCGSAAGAFAQTVSNILYYIVPFYGSIPKVCFNFHNDDTSKNSMRFR